MLKDAKRKGDEKPKRKLFSTIQIFEFLGDNRKMYGMTIEWESVGGMGMGKLFMSSDLTARSFRFLSYFPGKFK